MRERMPIGPLARRWTVFLVALTVLVTGWTVPAQALDFAMDDDEVAEAVYTKDDQACPTLTSVPDPVAVFFNTDDMNTRGYVDPGNQDSWDYLSKVAQIICGAKQNSTIKVGMFFVRALGTMTSKGLGDRPESDSEVIFDAMEFVKNTRNVKIKFVLEDSDITGAGPRAMVYRRLKNVADVWWCRNGCFNINSASKYPAAVNHEKFMTISDTQWENDGKSHPIVLSSSGNWARSQVRNFFQETTIIYGDQALFELFDYRYELMQDCAAREPDKSIRSTCTTSSRFKSTKKDYVGSSSKYKYDAFQTLSLKSKIWVDPVHTYRTDSGRGTSVSFAPVKTGTRDFYIEAFDRVDCSADPKIRVAMYQLSLPRAKTMVEALQRLKKAGCDAKVVLTARAGSSFIDPAVIKLLKSKKIWYRCAPLPLHTKIITIGADAGPFGRVMSGTANWSVAGLRYSEEHILTFDSRTASSTYRPALQRLYTQYLEGWYDLAKDARTSSC